MLQYVREVISAGDKIDERMLERLLGIRDPESLTALYAYADELNRQCNNAVVSFVLNRNVNYTNVCTLRCAFCAYCTSHAADTYVLDPVKIKKKIAHLDVTEVSLQGGLHPTMSYADLCDLLRAIKEVRQDIHIHGFSPMEIYYYARKAQKTYGEILRALMESGLDSLCGTAAEILDDEIRAIICKGKLSADEWSAIVTEAHLMGLPSTATILFGHIETDSHIAKHFLRIRAIQEKTGMFTEFIPLPFIPYHTALGKKYDLAFIGLERAKQITACARIFFHGTIRNIQTSWVKLGLDGALACLTAGANDLGGTLYEENITRAAGGEHGEFLSQDTCMRSLAAMHKRGYIRDTLYTFQKESACAVMNETC